MNRTKINLYFYIAAVFSILCLLYLCAYSIAKYKFIQRYVSNNSYKTKVLLVWGNGYGEQEQTHRFKIVGERLGLDLRVVSVKPKNLINACFLKDMANIAALTMQPDLILTIERNIPFLNSAPNYLVLDQSAEQYIRKVNNGVRMRSSLAHYAGLLPTFDDLDDLQTAFSQQGKIFNGFIWYPTVYRTNYVPQAAKKLFYPGGILRDVTRSSEKYTRLFKILDKSDYLAVYGLRSKWGHTPNSLLPPIEFDGVSLLEIQNAAGMSLILHDAEHLQGNVPSGRIFEAAAANTIIISDQHKFIMDNFGANVLYVDVNQNPEAIASQIQQHVDWIFMHPVAARKLAQNCHDIFIKKYTLEDQMQKLLELHNAVADHKKAR